MKRYPSVPRTENAPPDLFDAGHLWIQERVEGGHLRFRLRESGLLQFGDRDRTFDEIPIEYRHAVRHVRERFDRETLRNSVADVESVVFFGVATHRRGVDYDWDRLPSFLGFDVWDGSEQRFLPPDAVEQIYDRLGLRAVDAVEKEVRAVDFDPGDYEIPESAWYDGPAAGVVVRNKTGRRATIPHPDFEEGDDGSAPPSAGVDAPAPADAPVEDLAREYVTRDRVEAVVRELEARERPATFDAVYERVVEGIAREKNDRLFGDESAAIDEKAFRSAAAARTQELLET